ncbi:MAG TPA: sigma-70 family RNA polymerase sigma factor [Flavisolibacter sp.]|nr:sigma-70 family RNA polymerase sigma factor [Flavisolibacter sp.]
MSGNNSYNEVLILQQLSQDSEAAFEKIYNLYSTRLYGKMLKLLKSEAIAEEILQDVFLSVWEHRKKIDPEKSFCSFLFCMATNKCYDHFRKIARDKKMFHHLLRSSTPDRTAEDIVVRNEHAGTLYHVIELLPPRRKLVFELCKVQGKSYEEVSHELGISLSTISDHIVKANVFIRTELLKSF